MTDRERLIELYDKANQYADGMCADNGCDTCPYGEREGDCYEAAKFDYLIANGVTVRKKEKTVKFLPCKCGNNSHIEWFVQGGGIFYECRYCGLKSPEGRSKNEARKLWNEMICSAEQSEERPPEEEICNSVTG